MIAATPLVGSSATFARSLVRLSVLNAEPEAFRLAWEHLRPILVSSVLQENTPITLEHQHAALGKKSEVDILELDLDRAQILCPS